MTWSTAFLKSCAMILLAYLMQVGLDWLLPLDIPRLLVITIAGVVAMVWSWIDDRVRGLK